MDPNNSDAWANPDAVEFFSVHRSDARELYPSEKKFLIEVLKPGMTVLDVGCATGGMYAALRDLIGDIHYTGVDVSAPMIRRARERFPQAQFEFVDGKKLPFPDASFDVVISFGVLHMILNWRELLAECFRLTKKSFLFDLRLVEGESVEDRSRSWQWIAPDSQEQSDNRVPYVVLNAKEAVEMCVSLEPSISLRAYGYLHPIAQTARGPYSEVCMTSFCMERSRSCHSDSLQWEVPLQKPKVMV